MSIKVETRKNVILGVSKAIELLKSDTESMNTIRDVIVDHDICEESKDELTKNTIINNFIHMMLITKSDFVSCCEGIVKKVNKVVGKHLADLYEKYEQLISWFCNQDYLFYHIRTDNAVQGFKQQFKPLIKAYKNQQTPKTVDTPYRTKHEPKDIFVHLFNAAFS